MSTLARFIKNTVVLVVAKAIQPVITFYLIVVISRVIGVEGFGVYSTIFKYVMIFQIIAGFGLRNLLARDIAQSKEKSHDYVVASTYLAVIFAVISIVGMNILVWILSNDPLVKYGVLIASISLIATAIAEVYEGVITGHELIKQIGYALLGENVLRVALSLFLIYNGYGIIAVVWAFVLARFLYAFYFNFYISRRITKAFGKIDLVFIKTLFKQAKTFALIMICVTIYWNIDGIMLESIRSVTEAGYYSAAFRFLFLSMILARQELHPSE